MSNKEFKERYGLLEFRDMCKKVIEDLAVAKIEKKIKYYIINRKNNSVKVFYNTNKNKTLDFALIFTLGINNINKYLERTE